MSTLFEIKALGQGLMANCTGPNCGHGERLSLDMLIERFGPDYEMLNETRIGKACRCKACGHLGAAIYIMPDTSPHHSPVSKPSAYQRSKGG
jgi:hypothetical protein